MESRDRRVLEAPPLAANMDWLEAGVDRTSELLRQLRTNNVALDRLRLALEADVVTWGRGERGRVSSPLEA